MIKKVLLVCGLLVSISFTSVVNAEVQVADSEVDTTVIEEATTTVDNATVEESTGTIDSAFDSEEIPESEEGISRSARAATAYVNIYRLYNPNSGAHHYTKSASERNNLQAAGWRYEGIAWLSPKTAGSPVYRAYNPNSGEHVYTTNYNEVRNAVRAGWRDEGVGFRAGTYRSNVHYLPVYRVFNPNARNAGSHHYTKNWQEAANLIGVGWRYEGTAFYVK